jgi:hypothetical protein
VVAGGVSLTLVSRGLSALKVHSIRNIKVTKFLTDAGEELSAGITPEGENAFAVPGDLLTAPGQQDEQDSERISTGITVPFPSKLCNKVAQIKGTGEVLVKAGPIARLAMGKVSEVSGKRIKIEGINEGWVQLKYIKQGGEKKIRLACPSDMLGKLARVYFFAPDGSLIQSQVSDINHPSHVGGIGSIIISGVYPEGATAVLVICPGSKWMPVTFEGKDIPMLQVFTQGTDGFDMVMKSEPIEDGFALADIAPRVAEGEKKAQTEPAAEEE